MVRRLTLIAFVGGFSLNVAAAQVFCSRFPLASDLAEKFIS